MARTANAAVATGQTLSQDVVVGGTEFLTVIGVVGPTAGASGDVTITVQPYLDDKAPPNETLSDVLLPALETGVAVLANNKAQQIVRYRVSGLHKVKVFVKNNNAGTLPVEIDYDLG